MALREKRWLLAVTLLLSPTGAAAQSTITVEPDGSILGIVSYVQPGLIRVDPVTGAASVVSSNTVGSGPLLATPWDVAVESPGSLLVSDVGGGQERVLRVDAASGDRSLVSGGTTGMGPALLDPRALAVAADGSLFVADDDVDLWGRGVGRILRVDPATGDRSVISDSVVGSGPALGVLDSLALEAAGKLVATDAAGRVLTRIDPATGDRAIVSGGRRGRGPRLTEPRGLAVEASGTLVVANTATAFCVALCDAPFCAVCLALGPSVMRVDPLTGDRTLLSGGGHCLNPFGLGCSRPYRGVVGEGPDLIAGNDVAVESESSFVVADSHRVVRVDAVTGQRTVVGTVPLTAARTAVAGREEIYRPRNPQAWLRRALGAAYARDAARPLKSLLSGLSEPQRRRLGKCLEAALWKARSEVHTDVADR